MKYRYRTDEEMKDSGVEWLEKIPKQWKINKLKRELEFSVGATPSTSNKDFFEGENIWVTISDLKGKYCGESKTKITKEAIKNTNMKKVPCNSLLYSFKLSVGQVSFTTKELYTNEAIASFYPNEKYNLNFWYYALKTYLIENANENIYGAKLLNQDLINNANVFVPNKSEQEKIANFLDEKTSHFDSIISKKEELIKKLEEAKKSLISEVVTGKVKVVKTDYGYELVKRKRNEMKGSEVEWLGEIPKDWEVKKAKHFANIFIPQRNKPEFNDNKEGIPWITTEDLGYEFVNINKDTYYVNLKDQIKAGSKVLDSNSVITTCVGTFGISSINQEPVIINQQLQAFTNLKINTKYLNYFFKLISSYFESIATETTIKYVNRDKFENLKVTYPIKLEQQIIVSCLDFKLEHINGLIFKIKLQIEKLKEAKQSLISEAVTGKIEILD